MWDAAYQRLAQEKAAATGMFGNMALADAADKLYRAESRIESLVGEREELREALERARSWANPGDQLGPIWMACCRVCMNGPLAGDEVKTGLCSEHAVQGDNPASTPLTSEDAQARHGAVDTTEPDQLREALERAWAEHEKQHAYCSALSPELERRSVLSSRETSPML